MAEESTHGHFTFTYRADCITCEKYVGPKRKIKVDADQDVFEHKAIAGNEDHVVKIEVTQKFHLF